MRQAKAQSLPQTTANWILLLGASTAATLPVILDAGWWQVVTVVWWIGGLIAMVMALIPPRFGWEVITRMFFAGPFGILVMWYTRPRAS